MKEEASSVQAAELAALERRKEKEALEENEKEIERMKKWRFVYHLRIYGNKWFYNCYLIHYWPIIIVICQFVNLDMDHNKQVPDFCSLYSLSLYETNNVLNSLPLYETNSGLNSLPLILGK